jgi:cytochrome c-type biogenesis protein CcmE
VRRGRVIVALALIAGSLGWVAARGLSSALVYYQTPTELLQRGNGAVGERVRLGGLVEPGTVQEQGSTVRFLLTDQDTSMTVIVSGGVPSLFRAGAGVVVEGAYGRDGAFHADTVLVKHGDRYTPPKPGQTPPNSFNPG